MLNCCVLLDKCYSIESDIEDIDPDCLKKFLRVDLNDEYESFEDIYEGMNKIKIKNSMFKKKSEARQNNCVYLS